MGDFRDKRALLRAKTKSLGWRNLLQKGSKYKLIILAKQVIHAVAERKVYVDRFVRIHSEQ